MASATLPLRSCLRGCRSASTLRLPRPLRLQGGQPHRFLSSTPARRESKEPGSDDFEFDRVYKNPGEVFDDLLRTGAASGGEAKEVENLQDVWAGLPFREKQEHQKAVNDVRNEMAEMRRKVKVKRDSFWFDVETDTDIIVDETGEDEFEGDDIMGASHSKLEEHREHREYARVAIWEMPLLAKFAKPFEPPRSGEALRFRYTTYMGEFHPAEKKVVVEFSPRDLGLTNVQQLKLAKIAGARYNPEKRIIRMSCEMFEHQAQNKRYLGDLVEKMVAEAKDTTDTFEDIPLDTRHHTFKSKPKFPKEWRLTDKRKEELAAIRQRAFQLDQEKRNDGSLVDGIQRIQRTLAPPEAEVRDKVAELVAVPARSRASGRGAKRR